MTTTRIKNKGIKIKSLVFLFPIFLAIALGACSDDGGVDTFDAGPPWDGHIEDSTVDLDGGGGDSGQDGGISPVEPGCFYTHIPSTAGGQLGIAIRVEHPGTQGARYETGAPVVVEVSGGHGMGSLNLPESPMAANVRAGMIRIQFLYPGGTSENGDSGGDYDYRGPNCQQALADVILYAAGQKADEDGKLLTQRLPFALPSVVGAAGLSHGGNALLKTVEKHQQARSVLSWMMTWESPLGAQYINVELGRVGDTLNPFYTPGTCTLTSCPWPDMETQLLFDVSVQSVIRDPANGATVAIQGVLCLDADEDGICVPEEFTFPGLGGPGLSPTQPKLYHSPALTQLLVTHAATVFGSNGWPAWLADLNESTTFWDDRDASSSIQVLKDLDPAIPYIIGASVEDHVQGQPDHPHVRLPLQTLVDASYPFVRLNPDAVYVAGLLELQPEDIPENDANTGVEWPGTEEHLIPEQVEVANVCTLAAELELSDRVYKNDWSANLTSPLVNVEPNQP